MRLFSSSVVACFCLGAFVFNAGAARIWTLGVDTKLRLVDSAAPVSVLQTLTVSGLQSGEVLHDIDFRPATGQLLGLGSANRLYAVNTVTGAAVPIGSPSAFTLSGTTFGIDVNPVADRLRVVSEADQNLRLNPNDGALAAADTALSYAPGDPNQSANPNVVSCAYFNNVAGSGSTTLYGIDSALDVLVIHNPPNAGILSTVGSLGINASSIAGFDIWDFNGQAFAALAPPGAASSSLYTVNLATGAASLIGAIGGSSLVRGLAVVPAGSLRFSNALFYGMEGTSATITVTRVGGSYGGMTATYNTAPGTATAGADYQPVSGAISFADGETTKTFLVPLLSDTIPELNESVNLTLNVAPGDGVIGFPNAASLQIVSAQELPAYLLTVSNRLVRVSTNLATFDTSTLFTGLVANEVMLAIDFRPATGQLYGLGSSNHLYVINISSGGCAVVGSPGAFTLSGSEFGFDFNPTVDRIRVVSDLDSNLRLVPDTGGLAATDVALAYAAGDINQGVNPSVVACAYFNNYAGATVTALYGIDSGLNALVIHNPPNNGTLNTVGGLGVDVGSVAGFDYSEPAQTAYAIFNRPGAASELYTINLSTGAAQLAGAIGGIETIRDIAIPEPRPVLRINRAGTNAVVSWTAASLGYVLESASSFTAASWSSNPVAPVILNGQKTVTDFPTGSMKFFRLKK